VLDPEPLGARVGHGQTASDRLAQTPTLACVSPKAGSWHSLRGYRRRLESQYSGQSAEIFDSATEYALQDGWFVVDLNVGAAKAYLTLFGCGGKGVLFGLQNVPGLPSCGSTSPSLFSCPKDCDLPPGPSSGEPSGTSLSPEKEHQDRP
jgi:hypothetical protein